MTHPGTILSINKNSVSVQIESVSACAACQAHSRCGFAESKTKTLDIPLSCVAPDLRASLAQSDSQAIAHSQVLVTIDTSHGLLAVLIAYLLPALLLIGVIVVLSLAGLPEWAVILLSLASLGLYILLLVLFRQRIDNHFTLKVEKSKIEN
ncbi:MAG: SoxR reducing system RseC family protein [Bacteroidales bacterium]|nr:SoxR reducing system RseC family protein [Bacteroidales bacterium]